MNNRNPYLDKADAELKKVRAEFDKYVADMKSKAAAAQIKKDQEDMQARINERMNQVQSDFENLKESSQESFDEMKQKFQKSLDSLKETLSRDDSKNDSQ